MRLPRLSSLAPAAAVSAAAAALFLHARRFDFVCDDAFIALRYARNLSALGAPVYNAGERVEGYTSFLWMLLSALGYRLGLDVKAIVALLGGLSALTLMSAAWLVWTRFDIGDIDARAASAVSFHARGRSSSSLRIETLPRAACLFALASIALTAPVAVWTLGGLETCLYAGLLALSCALGATVAGLGGARRAALLGGCLALATLTRPEGAVAFGIAAGVALLSLLAPAAPAVATEPAAGSRRRALALPLGALIGSYLAFMAPYLIWRRWYYGDLLPNTFYLKTSGDPAELRANGVAYLLVAASDFGWAGWLLALGVVAPSPRRLPGESDVAARTRRACLWLLRLNVLAMFPYIVSVGGDFLGGYRFLAPLLPLAVVLSVAAPTQWLIVLEDRFMDSVPRWTPPVTGLAGALLVAAYGHQQQGLGAVINAGSSLARPPIRLEPLDWTRLYAKRWAALGRWIADHAEPGDSMAAGAAGAAPYYAGIDNIDILGLTDRYVARHGTVVGSRPGHQRFATADYLLSRKPVFLFYKNAYLSETPAPPRRDPTWERLGYVWVEAKIDPTRHGSPDSYYFHFQMRKDRAASLKNDPYAEVAIIPP